MPFRFILSYEHGYLLIRSGVDQQLEKLQATVCLLRETPNDVEQIYSVGVSVDAIKEGMLSNIGATGRGYRYLDPFSIATFDPDVASKAVAYLLLVGA
jgi:hypothetical protein